MFDASVSSTALQMYSLQPNVMILADTQLNALFARITVLDQRGNVETTRTVHAETG